MLFNLQPSSEVTGGAWYTDQELDTEFIDSLKTACLKYISARVSIRKEQERRSGTQTSNFHAEFPKKRGCARCCV